MGQGDGAHREDGIANEAQQRSTVSMCSVPQGFMGSRLVPSGTKLRAHGP